MKSGLEAHSRAYQKETPQAATGLQKSSPGPLECPEYRLGRREDSAIDSRTRGNAGGNFFQGQSGRDTVGAGWGAVRRVKTSKVTGRRFQTHGTVMRSSVWVLCAFFLLGFGARLSGFVISEIHYHPPFGEEDLQFIEISNDSSTPQDLSGWRFVEGISFKFPQGTILQGDGILVVCRIRNSP